MEVWCLMMIDEMLEMSPLKGIEVIDCECP